MFYKVLILVVEPSTSWSQVWHPSHLYLYHSCVKCQLHLNESRSD